MVCNQRVPECNLGDGENAPTDAGELIRRYQLICRLGRLVTSETDLEALFPLIMEQTNRFMDSERSSIFLFDDASEQLCSWASTDLQTNAIRISPQCGAAGWVFRNRTPLFLNAPYNDARFYTGVDKKTGFRTRNILCIPLINRNGRCIGTLQALNKRSGAFDERDQELLTAASYYMTIALENARLYQDLKALDRAKERVINHLSHEIKTPLSIIGGVLRHVASKIARGSTTGLQKSLQRGERNVKRLMALHEKMDDILQCQSTDVQCNPDIHRLAFDLLAEILDEQAEAHPQVVEGLKKRLDFLKQTHPGTFETIRLAGFLQNLCDRARQAMDRRELCLIQQFDQDAEIVSDRRSLEKVCEGLLKNAIENTPDEGIVEIGAERLHPSGVRVTIADHGVGISEADQKLIFSGFFSCKLRGAV